MRVVLTILLAVFLPLCGLISVNNETTVRNLAKMTIAPVPFDSAEKLYLVEVAVAVQSFSSGHDNAPLPTGADYRTAITADQIEHLLDVRVVFTASFYAYVVLLILIPLLLLVQIKRKGVFSLKLPFILGGAIPLGAALLLGLAVLIDFSAFFTWMHGIFFADGTWTFAADSLLIRALPYEFWVAAAIAWAGFMALFCAASIVVGSLIHQREKKLLDPSYDQSTESIIIHR